MRDPDEYEFWRIKEAILYPAANISRDKMIPELYRFKNKPDKLIIVYMGDERKGCAAANLFAEKGYENIFLLSENAGRIGTPHWMPPEIMKGNRYDN